MSSKEKLAASANEAELDAVMKWAVKASLSTSKPLITACVLCDG